MPSRIGSTPLLGMTYHRGVRGRRSRNARSVRPSLSKSPSTSSGSDAPTTCVQMSVGADTGDGSPMRKLVGDVGSLVCAELGMASHCTPLTEIGNGPLTTGTG